MAHLDAILYHGVSREPLTWTFLRPTAYPTTT